MWFALTAFCFFKPRVDVSESERRKLAQFPKLTVQSLLNGSYSRKFEEAALDQFPMRDTFRSVKSLSVYYVFRQTDNNGIYFSDGYASKLEYPLNTVSVTKAADKITDIYDTYLKNRAGNIYLCVVPDKNYFMAEEKGCPHIDYAELAGIIQAEVPFASYIDIFPLLNLDCYYKTDSHWRQEKLVPIAKAMGDAMGVQLSGDFTEKDAGIDFRGVYYGQSALPLEYESLKYLTNEALESCTVFDPTTGEYSDIYNMDKAFGRDPYEMFLSGAVPIITISNPSAETDRRLVVFRDSFGSSLVPLLAEGYSEITLADTRYILPQLLGDYIDFQDADVLFLYSASILNSSETLK